MRTFNLTNRLLYIIHAADDRALAIFLKSQCEASVPGLRAFVASKAGQIPTGADWLREIEENLQAATSFLLLLTPRSIQRYWVWYEAGVAWRSGLQRLPVAAAGLDRNHIPLPLGASQTLALDNPDDATQLFTDLGGVLDSPDEFCRVVKTLALPAPSAQPDEKHSREIREAFGELGEPPRLILRRMLSDGSLTLEEMSRELQAASYVSDPISVEKVRNVLRDKKLVEGDSEGRWRIKSDLKDILEQCFNPPLSKRLRDLARDMLAWGEGQSGGFDGNGYRQNFQTRLDLLRQKAANDYAEGDDWLTKMPSSTGGLKGIAEALERVAKRVP